MKQIKLIKNFLFLFIFFVISGCSTVGNSPGLPPANTSLAFKQYMFLCQYKWPLDTYIIPAGQACPFDDTVLTVDEYSKDPAKFQNWQLNYVGFTTWYIRMLGPISPGTTFVIKQAGGSWYDGSSYDTEILITSGEYQGVEATSETAISVANS